METALPPSGAQRRAHVIHMRRTGKGGPLSSSSRHASFFLLLKNVLLRTPSNVLSPSKPTANIPPSQHQKSISSISKEYQSGQRPVSAQSILSQHLGSQYQANTRPNAWSTSSHTQPAPNQHQVNTKPTPGQHLRTLNQRLVHPSQRLINIQPHSASQHLVNTKPTSSQHPSNTQPAPNIPSQRLVNICQHSTSASSTSSQHSASA